MASIRARLEPGQRLVRPDRDHLGGLDAGDLEQQARGEVGAAALLADRDAPALQPVEVGDVGLPQQVDFLVVEREDHLGLLRDPHQRRVALHLGDEGEHVRLHDAELGVRAFEHGVEVLDRPGGRLHPELDPLGFDQLLQVQPELVVRPLLPAGHQVHGGLRRRGRQKGADHQDQTQNRDAIVSWHLSSLGGLLHRHPPPPGAAAALAGRGDRTGSRHD